MSTASPTRGTAYSAKVAATCGSGRGAGDRQGRVDEREPGDLLGAPVGEQEADHPAHRVADEDDGAAEHLVDEAAEQGGVVVDARVADRAPGSDRTRQVERDDPAALGERGRDADPVEVRPAEPVDEDDGRRLASSSGAVSGPPKSTQWTGPSRSTVRLTPPHGAARSRGRGRATAAVVMAAEVLARLSGQPDAPHAGIAQAA